MVDTPQGLRHAVLLLAEYSTYRCNIQENRAAVRVDLHRCSVPHRFVVVIPRLHRHCELTESPKLSYWSWILMLCQPHRVTSEWRSQWKCPLLRTDGCVHVCTSVSLQQTHALFVCQIVPQCCMCNTACVTHKWHTKHKKSVAQSFRLKPVLNTNQSTKEEKLRHKCLAQVQTEKNPKPTISNIIILLQSDFSLVLFTSFVLPNQVLTRSVCKPTTGSFTAYQSVQVAQLHNSDTATHQLEEKLTSHYKYPRSMVGDFSRNAEFWQTELGRDSGSKWKLLQLVNLS